MTKPYPSNSDSSESKAHQNSATSFDTGLACLVITARFHQVAADPSQIKHHFGSHDAPLNEVDSSQSRPSFKAKSQSDYCKH